MATLFTSQTPSTAGNDNEHSLGQNFTIGSSGFQGVRGRVWVPATGFAASNTVWQLWNADTATMLAEFDLTTLSSPPTNQWSPWFNIGPITLNTGVNYCVCWHMPTGDPGYVYLAQTFPLVSSPFTMTAGVSSTGQASTVMPTSTFDFLYFADLEATSGSDVTVNLASEVDSAQTITVSSMTDISVGLSTEVDSAFIVAPAAGTANATINLATETDSAFSVTPSGSAPIVAAGGDLSTSYQANDLAGTLVNGTPSLTGNAALVQWATTAGTLTNTDGFTDVGALNAAFATNPPPQWETRNALLNEEAGTDDLSDTAALNDLANP